MKILSFRKSETSKRFKGFSLLEVLLSLFILSFSLSAIGYLAYVGISATTRGSLQSEGLRHAQSLLDEKIALQSNLDVFSVQKIPDDEDWYYQFDRQPSASPRVDHYLVTVWQPGRWSNVSRVSLERLVYRGESFE